MNIESFQNKLEKTLNSLKDYVEREKFSGYDPIDIFNSYLPLKFFPDIGRAILSQLHLRNPINIRPIIGIEKGYNPMAIGVLLEAYVVLNQILPSKKLIEIQTWLFEKLLETRSEGFQGSCWGNNFDWAGRDLFVPKHYPNIVTTCKVGKGIFEYYKYSNDPRALDVLKKIGVYLVNSKLEIQSSKGLCFSYTDLKEEACYNANMLAAEMLSKIYSLTNKLEYKDLSDQATNFTLAYQKEDGHWNYSINLKTGVERKQIDFHQGYILMSLAEYLVYSKGDPGIEEKILKGMEYYQKVQFFPNGRAKWRVPKEYPIETHHHATGIITFTKLSNFNQGYTQHAILITNWAIDNLFDKRGFFYYRINKTNRNKISYMRWSQSFMMLALTILLQKIKTFSEVEVIDFNI